MQFSGKVAKIIGWRPTFGVGTQTLKNLESATVSVTGNSLCLHLAMKNLLIINYLKDSSGSKISQASTLDGSASIYYLATFLPKTA